MCKIYKEYLHKVRNFIRKYIHDVIYVLVLAIVSVIIEVLIVFDAKILHPLLYTHCVLGQEVDRFIWWHSFVGYPIIVYNSSFLILAIMDLVVRWDQPGCTSLYFVIINIPIAVSLFVCNMIYAKQLKDIKCLAKHFKHFAETIPYAYGVAWLLLLNALLLYLRVDNDEELNWKPNLKEPPKEKQKTQLNPNLSKVSETSSKTKSR